MALRLVIITGVLVLAVSGLVLASTPSRPEAPSATPTPAPTVTPAPPDFHSGPALAEDLTATTDALDAAVDRWGGSGDPPADVLQLAARQQSIYRSAGPDRPMARSVIANVPKRLRAEVRDNMVARRELTRITSVHVGPPPKIVVRHAQPADKLRAHYRRAWRRFHVGPPLLAAVNFVESAFGRLRNRSVSGARGPMQFMPATWRAYGLGGDISDPRDAILGAANYLHANGAPDDERGALYHYNPSAHYVEAISRYARRIRADPRAFYEYYAWQVYVRGKVVPPG